MCWRTPPAPPACGICDSLTCPSSLPNFLSKFYYFFHDVNEKVEFFPALLTWVVLFSVLNFFYRFVSCRYNGCCKFSPVLGLENICNAVLLVIRFIIPFVVHFGIWRPYYFFWTFLFGTIYKMESADTMSNAIVCVTSLAYACLSLNRNWCLRAQYVTQLWREFCWSQQGWDKRWTRDNPWLWFPSKGENSSIFTKLKDKLIPCRPKMDPDMQCRDRYGRYIRCPPEENCQAKQSLRISQALDPQSCSPPEVDFTTQPYSPCLDRTQPAEVYGTYCPQATSQQAPAYKVPRPRNCGPSEPNRYSLRSFDATRPPFGGPCCQGHCK